MVALGPMSALAEPVADEAEEPAGWIVRPWQGWTVRAARCEAAAAGTTACEGEVIGRLGPWWMTAEQVVLGPGVGMHLRGEVRLYGPALTLAADAATWEPGRFTTADGGRVWREDRWLGADRVSVTMDDGRVELEAVKTDPDPARSDDDATETR